MLCQTHTNISLKLKAVPFQEIRNESATLKQSLSARTQSPERLLCRSLGYNRLSYWRFSFVSLAVGMAERAQFTHQRTFLPSRLIKFEAALSPYTY